MSLTKYYCDLFLPRGLGSHGSLIPWLGRIIRLSFILFITFFMVWCPYQFIMCSSVAFGTICLVVLLFIFFTKDAIKCVPQCILQTVIGREMGRKFLALTFSFYRSCIFQNTDYKTVIAWDLERWHYLTISKLNPFAKTSAIMQLFMILIYLQ
jgi:hypothetical protein